MASSRSLGTLTLDLILKAGGFTAPLTKAERDLNKTMTAMERRAYKFGQVLGSGLKLAAGVAASALAVLSVAVGKAINDADNIRDLSIRLGVGTESLSAFGYAATQTGTDLESLGNGMKFLAKNATAALEPTSKQAKIFDALGISVKDATGHLKDIDVLIPEVADAFKNMEDGTTKTSLALALLGKSGLELVEFFNQGSDGLKTLTDRARELGVVISEQTAADADEFKDILGDLKAISAGLALDIASKLLPALIDGARDLRQFAQEGDIAESAATALGAGLKAASFLIELFDRTVRSAVIGAELFTSSLSGLSQVVLGLGGNNMPAFINGVRQLGGAYKQADDEIKKLNEDLAQHKRIQENNRNLPENFSAGSGRRGRATADEIAATARAATDMRKLEAALGGVKSPKAKGGGGKSDEVKEAEKLLELFKRMKTSYIEQAELVGEVTELEKLRFEFINGEAAKFSPAQQAELETLAAKADAAKIDNDLTEESIRLHESLRTPLEQVNEYRRKAKELLDAGYSSQEDYNRALEAQLTPFEEISRALEDEILLLGLDAEAQEILTTQRLLGKDASEQELQAIRDLVVARQDLQKSNEAFEEFRSLTTDMFADIISGSKSAGDAFDDFGKRITAMVARLLAERLFEKLFASFASTGGASGGAAGGTGFWAGLIGALFGGPKARGGSVRRGMFYEVNENGPEVLTVGSKDYLMMGNQSGKVTPNAKGAGMTQNNQFLVVGSVNRETQQQVFQRTYQAGNRALSRNR